MAATKAEHALHVPDTFASEAGYGDGRDPAAEAEQPRTTVQCLGRLCCKAMQCLVGVAFLALVVLLLGAMAIDLSDGPPEYSAALAAAAPGGRSKQAPNVLPALFNLTVHIKNPSRLHSAYCLWRDAAAVVTYGGATIGAGTVPWFCAGRVEEREVAAPVWGAGAGADVTLPLALQSRGEAVDVALRVPRSPECRSQAEAQVIACRVKVGGGLSLCTSSCSY